MSKTPLPTAPLIVCVLVTALPAQTEEASPVRWHVLRPIQATAREGATLAVQDDGSVLVSGEPAGGDQHTVVCETELARITGVRLEALPDASLPDHGPGRGGNGRFGLGEIVVAHSLLAKGRAPQPLAFVDAVTPSNGTNGMAYRAADGNTSSSWVAHRPGGKKKVVLFALAGPIGDERGSRLDVTLCYPQRSKAQVGRFRVSVTTDPGPLRGLGAPMSEGWIRVQMRINDAIDKGVDALLAEQELDGSWRAHAERYPSGQTALSLYALLHSGVAKNDAAVQRALAFVRAHPPIRTYEAACQILALCAYDDPADKKRVQAIVDKLVSWQRGYGIFGYPAGAGDLSNTHYAAMSLWVAAKKGFNVQRRVWDRLVKVALRHQEPVRGGPVTRGERPAGFRYRENGDATGSMTAAGVTILGVCEQQIRRKRQDVIKAKNRGLAWLREYFSQTGNPQPSRGPGMTIGNLHYYLYALERAGAILDITHFGAHDWYRKGALHLVDTQQPSGHWNRSQPFTCFSLLFLTKATARASFTGNEVRRGKRIWGEVDAKAAFSVRIAGDAPHGMWVLSWGAKTLQEHGHFGDSEVKFLKIARVDYYAAPAGQRAAAELLQSVAGDPNKTERDQRFAIQHQFEERGPHVVWAKATLITPAGEEIVVESKPIELLVTRIPNESLLDYASDGSRNLLAGAKVTVAASSEQDDAKALRATDNLLALGWRSEPGDALPWLSIELARPVKANHVLLSHIQESIQHARRRSTRIRNLVLEINGKKKTTYPVEMHESDWQKTVFRLPRTLPIRSLLVRVQSVWPSAGHRSGVGLGEVELQLRK